MLKKKLHIIFFFIGYCNVFTCYSQSISVRASANRDKILIGEPIELKLEVQTPIDVAVKWFPLDSLEHFEFIDQSKIDTLADAVGKKYLQTITLTSFDSGRWHIPALPLETGNKYYLTDSIPVSVAFSVFDSTQAYHDIKDIVSVEIPSLSYVNWIIAAATVLSVLAIIYFLRKKVVLPPVITTQQPVSHLSPLKEALQALQVLDLGTSDVKKFHTQLNDIFRQFVYRKTGNSTMEKTSNELMLQLKSYPLSAEDFTLLAQTLRMNDAVKFAKYKPDTTENKQSLAVVQRSVELLDKAINRAM
jgi:hypothetical protein